MTTFSWTDGVRAVVASCLPCFTSRSDDANGQQEGARTQANRSNGQHRLRVSQRDELEGLLGDVLGESDTDAETVSLHSNFGGRGRRKAKRKQRDGRSKHIRIFGFDLFGRPPIQLPESDDESGSRGPRRKSRRGKASPTGTITAGSSSTEAFDSDAAPLDRSTLDQLSPQEALRLAQAAQREQEALEAEARRVKEEKEDRRRKRRERRELRKAAMGLGMDDNKFEGFQGSGPGLPAREGMSPMSSTVASSVAGEGVGEDAFGPFVGASSRRDGGSGDDPDAGLADFGGEAYARKSRLRTGNPDGSRSVTSASQSNPDSAQPYNHHSVSQAPELTQTQTLADLPRKKKSKKSRATVSNTPTSQSASLPSPIDTPIDFDRRFANQQDPYIVVQSQPPIAQPMILSPSMQTQFEGIPPDSSNMPTSGFPSVGFKGVRRKSVDATAFLANRGN